MNKGKEIRCYDYVNHPYEKVRAAFSKSPTEVFQKATKVAASRARSVASQLKVNIAGVDIGADVLISVDYVEQHLADAVSPAITRMQLEWQAENLPRLFPFMKAELSIYPLTSTETQLDFLGHYEPPLGVLGAALDSIAGHRAAEASVHRFLSEVAQYLRKEIADYE